MGWRYYIVRPCRWFRDCGRKARDWYHKIKFGWTYSDVWNWDCWFIETVPPMLRYLAKNACGYPGIEPFETPEKWSVWLENIATLIETASESYQDKHNEYYEEYIGGLVASDRWIDEFGLVHSRIEDKDILREKYFAREKELAAEGQKNIEIAMCELGKYFYYIWD